VILEAERLHYSHGPRAALSGLSFAVEAGETFGILGPNGCGKSTLFRLVSTVLPLQQGEVRIQGIPLRTSPRLARRRFGVVFQAPSFDRRLSALENMLAQGALYGLSGQALRERTNELLAAFHLDGRANDLAGSLSGGLQRRLEIAKALLHRPPLLLLDEASAGLDPAARRELFLLLDHLRRQEGLTTVFTTHLMDEAETAARLLLMHEGRAAVCDTPQNLKAAVQGDVVVFHHPVQGLAARLRERFQADVRETEGVLRVEISGGHRFLAAALDAFPGCAQGVEVHRPSLEDAYLQYTGAAFHG
jgi:ABC-2 type transport system ATP-binding protein